VLTGERGKRNKKCLKENERCDLVGDILMRHSLRVPYSIGVSEYIMGGSMIRSETPEYVNVWSLFCGSILDVNVS
jgi:hypothetical protein